MPDPLAVLLLPERLEEFAFEDHARDLLRAPRVIALEPPRVSWTRLARLPEAFAPRVARRQARRLELPGSPRVVMVYEPLQMLLALGLLMRYPDAELWYVRSRQGSAVVEPKLQRRIGVLDDLAREHAVIEIPLHDLVPLASARTWFEANAPLWHRLEELEIAQFRG